ncbi:hypothetical protein ACHAXS_002340 [Conticribra weissflogii]
MITLTYLEFYSGIGGWGYAVEQACRSIQQNPPAHFSIAARAAIDALDKKTAGGNASLPRLKKAKISKSNSRGVLYDEEGDCDADDDNLGRFKSSSKLEIKAKLLAAFDHSDLCNSVFHHNHISQINSINTSQSIPLTSTSEKTKSKKSNLFQHLKPNQTPIQRLTTSQLESHNATIWCMSPPCQPHTRQHSNQHKELEDPRSASFLHLCDILIEMREEYLPELILCENVVGFEESLGDFASTPSVVDMDGDTDGTHGDSEQLSSRGTIIDSTDKENGTTDKTQSNPIMGSFQKWRTALAKRNYSVGHFHLDPTHVGIPNNRPRYYCVAFRKGANVFGKLKIALSESHDFQNDICYESSETQERNHHVNHLADFSLSLITNDVMDRCKKNIFCREELTKPPSVHNEKSLWGNNYYDESTLAKLPCLRSFLDTDMTQTNPQTPTSKLTAKRTFLQIPEKIRSSASSWCFDIVTPCHRRSSCFTHSYGKFIRGTGSILYTGPLSVQEGRDIDDGGQWCNALLSSYLVECKNKESRSNNENAINPPDLEDAPTIERFQLANPEERSFDATWSQGIDWDNHMRYLSGTEIARLMGFPVAERSVLDCSNRCLAVSSNEGINSCSDDSSADIHGIDEQVSNGRKFTFPPNCTMKQQWKLLGNSLNVRVAGCVAEIGIRSLLDDALDACNINH